MNYPGTVGGNWLWRMLPGAASDALARLHTAAHLPVKMEYRRESLVEECIRHNVEIRKIRKYLQTKKKKNEFEKLLLASAGPYLEQGERAAAEMKASSYEKLRQRADEEGAVCHGEFSQHNILLENGRGETAVNFDKWNFDLQVADLGYFMRKILEKQNVSSVIIDLRSNGGGALTEAVSLSGLFIPAGPIVQVRDNNGKVREDSDTDGQVFYKGPLVVLVDRFSASASEIFAAAMQDYGRALVVGEPTFGKGTVQQYRSLNRIYDQMLRPEWPALGSVQYTIQKFYRVNGGSTQRKGVTPDIIMPTGNEETETGEKFEDNALPWDSIDAATYVKSGDLTAFEPELLKEHNARIAKDPEFQNIMKDIARFNAMKDKRNIVSLNYAVREKENNEDDATRLARLNERFKREGKPELKKLDDLPKDYQEPDPYLDETVNIALDLAKLEKARPAEQPAPVK